jgi:hypothetical protein
MTTGQGPQAGTGNGWHPEPPRSEEGGWHVLARIPVRVDARTLWKAMLDKTEHPERYNPSIERASVLDHDPTVVLRRIWPTSGTPFEEYVRHTVRARRVEYRHHGAGWAYAQAIVEVDDEPCLVYEVDDPTQAASCAGITPEHAQRTLRHLLERAGSLLP